MKTFLMSFLLIAVTGSAWAQELVREEIRRTPVPGSDTMEVIVSRLSVPVGATVELHTHPGDEHTVVITDSRAQTPSGKVLEFAVGTPLFFPDGAVHGGLTNVGEADMVAITTHVVRKDEPFIVPAN
jgi:quercetin dioxygenase-like cupin family protein